MSRLAHGKALRIARAQDCATSPAYFLDADRRDDEAFDDDRFADLAEEVFFEEEDLLDDARSGFPLRLPFAMSLSCFSLIDFAMLRDAPLSELLDVSPRLAESAAPAAFCCAFDFAGI
jgi:hypothetical protein